MDAEQINKKIELSEKAAELYVDDTFSIPNLIDATGFSASEIYALFPNKESLLEFYYTSLIIRYEAMISEIKDFESFTLAEKLSSFVYTVFDLMAEKEEFVQQTYYSLIYSDRRSEFKAKSTEIIKDFIESDEQISMSATVFMNKYFYGFLSAQYLHLIDFWLKDNSDQKEKTAALTDKFTGLLQEGLYNKLVDKSIDFIKYIFNQSDLSGDIKSFIDKMESTFTCDEANKETDSHTESADESNEK